MKFRIHALAISLESGLLYVPPGSYGTGVRRGLFARKTYKAVHHERLDRQESFADNSTMFLFERPTNYGEMLKKIGTFTFIIAFGLTLLAGNCSAAISNWLNRIQLPVEVWSLHIPVLYVVPGLLLAILARIIRLHDKISDLFGIRERFDLNRILVPLCGAVGIPVDLPFRNKLLNRRQNAMRRTFYRYASFEDPAISKASVLGAIDVWTWYWILLEGIALLLIAAITLAVVRAYAACCGIIATAFLATLLFGTYYGICGRRADSQIEEITSDEQRVVTIRNEFDSIRQA